MEPIADLGRELARLRSICGLSVDECATSAGMTAIQVVEAESGDSATAARLLGHLHALDAAELRDGFVVPVEGIEGATVFLFHGAYQDFDADDLASLDRAMRVARVLAGSPRGADSLRCRLQFVPARPAGPAAADAARQGYKLARVVRRQLSWGAAPLGDMRELLEEQLGVAVLVDDLVTADLRAASILDAGRSAAAALLSAADPERHNNPVLARVYLAHELCHLLFDPGDPGHVRVALDDRFYERISAPRALPTTALLESRAKGFAAELLMPLDGLRQLLGTSLQETSVSKAATMLQDVRAHFGTPCEIAIHHLKNLGFIDSQVVHALLRLKGPSPGSICPTSLPAVGAVPAILETAGAEALLQSLSAAAVQSEPIPAIPPTYVATAREQTRLALQAAVDDVVSRARSAVEQERPVEATNLVTEALDDYFQAESFEAAARMLGLLDADVFPPPVLIGALTVTWHAREKVGTARVKMLERVETALKTRWGQPPELVASTVARLR